MEFPLACSTCTDILLGTSFLSPRHVLYIIWLYLLCFLTVTVDTTLSKWGRQHVLINFNYNGVQSLQCGVFLDTGEIITNIHQASALVPHLFLTTCRIPDLLGSSCKIQRRWWTQYCNTDISPSFVPETRGKAWNKEDFVEEDQVREHLSWRI